MSSNDGSRAALLAPGRVLSSSDAEPPLGVVVRDIYGDLWQHRTEHRKGWSPREEDGSPVNGDPESWTRVAGNYGPVTVTQSKTRLVQPGEPS